MEQLFSGGEAEPQYIEVCKVEVGTYTLAILHIIIFNRSKITAL
jgi:hypothetical protein